MELTSLSHCLDPDGVIIAVSDTYKPFAFANGGRLNGGEVLGRPLLSFVQGEALKGFLADFLEGSRALPGRLPYRCDSPRELRFWEVEAHSEDTGLVGYLHSGRKLPKALEESQMRASGSSGSALFLV